MNAKISKLVENNYGMKVIKIKKCISYEDEVFIISTKHEDPVTYVLHILAKHNSIKTDQLKEMFNVMNGLPSSKICVPKPILTQEGEMYFKDNDRVVYLFNHFDGNTLENLSESLSDEEYLTLIKKIGLSAGILIIELQKLEIPKNNELQRETFPFDTANLANLRPNLSYVMDDVMRQDCLKVIEMVSKELDECDPSKLQRGIVHGDVNVSNIIVRRESFVGFIDFNNLHVGFYIFEISSILTYIMMNIQQSHPNMSILKSAKIVFDNILESVSLSEQERNLLYVGILGRCALIIVFLSRYMTDPPKQTELCKRYLTNATNLFKYLSQFNREEVLKHLLC